MGKKKNDKGRNANTNKKQASTFGMSLQEQLAAFAEQADGLKAPPKASEPEESKNQYQNYGKHKVMLGRVGEGSYVGSPYNFVPVSKKVMEYPMEKGIPAHNSTASDLLSGEIVYEIEAVKPVCVGGNELEGVTEFYRNAYGKYAIPGSTLRGLIRSNAQILSRSYIGDDIDDYKLMYREVAGGPFKDQYNTVLGNDIIKIKDKSMSVLKNVRSGYIRNESGKYVIYGTEKDNVLKEWDESKRMNYYVISERSITEHTEDFAYLYSEGFPALQYKKGAVFTKMGIHWKSDDANDKYKPFYAPVSYKVNTKNRIMEIQEPGKAASFKQGNLVGTGKMQEKKVLYVIPQMDENRYITQIPQKDIDAYRFDLNKKETIFKANGTYDFYSLPKEGEMRPVFYIYLDGNWYFGYTPHLRLFFDHSVKEGLRQEKPEMDYAKALFGYSEGDKGRKTRISFADAVTDTQTIPEVRSYVLNGPKPTSYLDYLEQQEYVSSYNDTDFALRGIKQYWNKADIDEPVPGKNDSVVTSFETLKEGTKFNGTIRFHNLREEELGLLLWSLEPEEVSLHNIGRGKPYGFGMIQIKVKEVKRFDTDKAYSASAFCMNPETGITEETRRSYVKQFQKLADVDADLSIKTFKTMKSVQMPNKFVRYMSIENNREFQYRKKKNLALPTADEVVNKKNNQEDHGR